ncbi:polyprenyl synthetase family protein [Candidatus Pelagibacter sp.]|nr:polyprenyl synthetase family protein [Candidatus Pelagibacter sp.]
MKTELDRIAKDTNLFLKKFLKQQNNSKLIPAMNYGLFPGGKKIRSKVLIDIGSLLSTDYKTLIAIGAAVECIHAYSLIHDDLPCMDNDLFRRGKPSTHIKFGESTAVLAGNSLLTMAFEILTSPTLKISEKIKINLIKKLSQCSGHLGIAGGQYLDLSYEKKNISKNKIIEMEIKKQENYLVFAVLYQQSLRKKILEKSNFLKIWDLILVYYFK